MSTAKDPLYKLTNNELKGIIRDFNADCKHRPNMGGKKEELVRKIRRYNIISSTATPQKAKIKKIRKKMGIIRIKPISSRKPPKKPSPAVIL